MGLRKVLFLSFFLGIAVVFGGFYIQSSQDKTLQSPIPFFLSILENNQVSTVDFWKPSGKNILSYASAKTELTAQAVFV